MNRPLILGAAALVGVLGAVMMIQTPDTGGDVPTSVDRPLDEPAPAVMEEVVLERGTTINPVNKVTAEARSTPEAISVGQHGASWSLIRRELSSQDADEALMLEVSTLVRDLRDARRVPQNADFAALAATEAEVRAKIEAAGLVNDIIRESFGRMDAE